MHVARRQSEVLFDDADERPSSFRTVFIESLAIPDIMKPDDADDAENNNVFDHQRHLAMFWTDILHLMSSKPQALMSVGPMRALAANSKKIAAETMTMTEDYVEFGKHLSEYYAQLADTWAEAQKKVNAKAPEVPQDVEQAEALKRIWVDMFDNDFTDLFDSPKFGANYGRLVSKELEIVNHWNNIANIVLKSVNLPSKEEIDEVYREIHSLKKRLRISELEIQRLRRSAAGQDARGTGREHVDAARVHSRPADPDPAPSAVDPAPDASAGPVPDPGKLRGGSDDHAEGGDGSPVNDTAEDPAPKAQPPRPSVSRDGRDGGEALLKPQQQQPQQQQPQQSHAQEHQTRQPAEDGDGTPAPDATKKARRRRQRPSKWRRRRQAMASQQDSADPEPGIRQRPPTRDDSAGGGTVPVRAGRRRRRRHRHAPETASHGDTKRTGSDSGGGADAR